ncbi:hypothetical protein NVP3058O_100 [Vibrio phage 3.058.O._10N.286.46.B8]|nr:hypothetical protein NVP2058O_101 [Vibrio phage 2.058.O._10N.286.46.B8]AUS03170.1 hypothetical protein NVP3058O_100 [Vibrio phage 3.058.O._10N.286.46.B8]
MTITTNTVFENTKSEVADYVNNDDLKTIIAGIETKHGVKGLREFENSVTVMHDTQSPELLDYMEELMEEHLEG